MPRGRHEAPDLLTLTAEDVREDTSVDDQLAQAVATHEKSEAIVGKPGVAVATLTAVLKKSDKTVRRKQASKGVVLYGVDGE